MSIFKTSAVVAMVAALSGCATPRDIYEGTVPASVGDLTTQNLALRNIPPPSRRQVVAVRGLDDQTGQYKERELVQTLSRAVTQAGREAHHGTVSHHPPGSWPCRRSDAGHGARAGRGRRRKRLTPAAARRTADAGMPRAEGPGCMTGCRSGAGGA